VPEPELAVLLVPLFSLLSSSSASSSADGSGLEAGSFPRGWATVSGSLGSETGVLLAVAAPIGEDPGRDFGGKGGNGDKPCGDPGGDFGSDLGGEFPGESDTTLNLTFMVRSKTVSHAAFTWFSLPSRLFCNSGLTPRTKVSLPGSKLIGKAKTDTILKEGMWRFCRASLTSDQNSSRSKEFEESIRVDSGGVAGDSEYVEDGDEGEDGDV
jgi:hypothetical protein